MVSLVKFPDATSSLHGNRKFFIRPIIQHENFMNFLFPFLEKLFEAFKSWLHKCILDHTGLHKGLLYTSINHLQRNTIQRRKGDFEKIQRKVRSNPERLKVHFTLFAFAITIAFKNWLFHLKFVEVISFSYESTQYGRKPI